MSVGATPSHLYTVQRTRLQHKGTAGGTLSQNPVLTCKRTTVTTLKGMCCDTGWGEDGVGAVCLPLPVAQSHDLSFRVERQDFKSSHRTTHVFPSLVSSTCEQGSGCAAVAKLLDWVMQVGLLLGFLEQF